MTELIQPPRSGASEGSDLEIYQAIHDLRRVSAGPTYTVGRLAESLAAYVSRSEIWTIAPGPVEWPYDAPINDFPGQFVSTELVRQVYRVANNPKAVVHGHGIWRFMSLFSLFMPRDRAAKIVFSPRGMFSRESMSHRQYRKRPFWWTLQRPALNRVDCFHATSQQEFGDIRRLGFRQPVAIIPNGVDIPPVAEPVRQSDGKTREILYLGRLHPIKGLDSLLTAWKETAPSFPEWRLKIVGPIDSGYARALVDRARNECPQCECLGELTGEDRSAVYRAADLFVLPSYSENFGVVVAEALAHGVPVIASTGTPWEELRSRSLGWWVDPTAEALQRTLNDALSIPLPRLREMGDRGRDWMRQSYNWTEIGSRMSTTYRWLHGIGPRPPFVQSVAP